MIERPAASSSLARANTESAPSPLITPMREAGLRTLRLPLGQGWHRGGGNPQNVNKAGEEFESGSGTHEFDDLRFGVSPPQLCVKVIVNFVGRAMQPISRPEAQLFRFFIRSALVILQAVYLRVGGAFLLRRSRVSRSSIIAPLQQRHSCGHQLLVPSRQSAIAHQRLEKACNSQG